MPPSRTSKRPRVSSSTLSDGVPASVAGIDSLADTDIEDLLKLRACRDARGSHGGNYHSFDDDEISSIRQRLLSWYDVNQRVLPWRRAGAHCPTQCANTRADGGDETNRAYRVWVSEIMLQQTQVSKVIAYYEKWIARWPTPQSLASATLEEVNEVWSGLGYYSRARRLHESAKRIMEELGGVFPSTSDSLIKELSGVGRYTAGAVASIAFGECVPVVDGNVVRVLSRLRCIGSDPKSSVVVDKMWKLAEGLVDLSRPGDFNQAVMELGATVCTPQTPKCNECPLRRHCRALAESDKVVVKTGKPPKKSARKEAVEECTLCHEHFQSVATSGTPKPLDVLAYPSKTPKKKSKEQTFAVGVAVAPSVAPGFPPVHLVVKRPEKGLLGGLWEFPNKELAIEDDDDVDASLTALAALKSTAAEGADIDVASLRHAGTVCHVFSHVKHTYEVYTCGLTHAFSTTTSLKREILDEQMTVDGDEKAANGERVLWITGEQISGAALSTAMRKVYECAIAAGGTLARQPRSKKIVPPPKGQKSIGAFFKKSS